MVRKLTIILIIIIIILLNFQYSYAASQQTISVNSYKNEDLGILAYKQVNAFQLKLSNGYVLADAGLTTASNVSVEEDMKNVKIVFVIDTSGSMASGGTAGTRCEVTKTATQSLVDSLFDKIGAEHLNIGIIYFNNGVKAGDVLTLTNNKNDIDNHLNNIYASGGTYMKDALTEAKDMLNDSSESDEIKIVCTLTDGELADKTESINEFKTINEAGISTMSIFVEMPIPSEFQSLEMNNSLHKNFQTSTANLADTIVNDLYAEIYMKIVLMSDPVTTYNTNNVGILR